MGGWRGSALIYTAFLLFMVAVALGYTDRMRWKWLVTAGALTYPLYLTHYLAGTVLISRLRDTMDPRLLVAVVIAVCGASGGPAAEAGPGHVVRPAAERDEGMRCRGPEGLGAQRGTRTTPSWITDTASRPSCV